MGVGIVPGAMWNVFPAPGVGRNHSLEIVRLIAHRTEDPGDVRSDNIVRKRTIREECGSDRAQIQEVTKARQVISRNLNISVTRRRLLESEAVGVTQRRDRVALNQNIAWASAAIEVADATSRVILLRTCVGSVVDPVVRKGSVAPW